VLAASLLRTTNSVLDLKTIDVAKHIGSVMIPSPDLPPLSPFEYVPSFLDEVTKFSVGNSSSGERCLLEGSRATECDEITPFTAAKKSTVESFSGSLKDETASAKNTTQWTYSGLYLPHVLARTLHGICPNTSLHTNTMAETPQKHRMTLIR
jgi:hypothetical protein